MKKFLFTFLATTCFLTAQVNFLNSPPKYDKEQARIEKLVRKYQHIYNMDGIVIAVKMIPQSFILNACGESMWGIKYDIPFGIVLVVREEDYNKPDKDGKYSTCNSAKPRIDQENTVAHELGHFVYEFAEDEEMAVSVFANAIVRPHLFKEPKIKSPKKKKEQKKETDPIFDDFPKY